MCEYPTISHRLLEPYFSTHMSAMTKEKLIDKADIAAQLALRDKIIDDLYDTVYFLIERDR